MNPRLRSPRQFAWTVTALEALFLLALAVAASVLIWNNRSNTLQETQSQILRFTSGAEVAINRFFLGIDVLLASTEEGLGVAQLGPAGQVGQVGETPWAMDDVARASKLLRVAADHSLQVRSIALMDARANVMASSDFAAGVLPSLQLPKAFFQEVLGAPFSMLAVSAPTVSFSSSEQVVYLVRRFQSGEGALFLAVAEVPVEMLVSVLMQGVVMPGLEVTLERSNGTLLLALPDGQGRTGEVLSPPLQVLQDQALQVSQHTSQKLQESKKSQNTRNTQNSQPPSEEKPYFAWKMNTRISHTTGQVESRRLLYPDLWVSAGLPLEAALSNWRTESRAIMGVAGVFGGMLVVAGFLAVGSMRRMDTAQQALAQSKETLDQALESMVSGFVLLDAQRRVRQWNHRFEETFPWLLGAMVKGIHFRKILEITSQHILTKATPIERQKWVERRLRKPNNLRRPYEVHLTTGRYIQITERPTPEGGVVFTYHDVTKLHRASAEIEHLVFYDPLTSLPNRRLLLERLEHAITNANGNGNGNGNNNNNNNNSKSNAKHTNGIGALLFLDLDDFKSLNDAQGHAVGDMLLKEVAQRLCASVRPADTVARLASDEFVILLSSLSVRPTEAGALAQHMGESILKRLAQPYLLGEQPYQGTCSMGAVLFDSTTESATDLLKQADIAMSQNKLKIDQGNGNSVCFFDPEMETAICARAQLETDLQLALTKNEFLLYYQPQFTKKGKIIGAEALLRWKHPLRGMVPPGNFIPAAEESDLIVTIGDWVMHTACQQLADWKNDPELSHLLLAVNVSSRQFSQPDFVDKVIGLIQKMEIRPHLLKLELTESMVLNNVNETIDKMHQLRTKGVRFSVDDFGTGYSSLAYLTQLPLNQLKIDQSFVRNLGVRPSDDVIVQTIIGMARNLELEVIAEGVETEAQKSFLAQYGCDLYQGYLMGRPMPVESLMALLYPKTSDILN